MNTVDWSGRPCPYDLRHSLFCKRRYVRKGPTCHNCYMRQQAMNFNTMTREGVYVDRVCDKCGGEISNPDSALYLLLEGREGEIIANLEICRECAAELAEWIGGIELPRGEKIDEITDAIWD